MGIGVGAGVLVLAGVLVCLLLVRRKPASSASSLAGDPTERLIETPVSAGFEEPGAMPTMYMGAETATQNIFQSDGDEAD
jgi:hypothetical protein